MYATTPRLFPVSPFYTYRYMSAEHCTFLNQIEFIIKQNIILKFEWQEQN